MPVYSSAGLGDANEHPHPVAADGNARWPQVFFDDTPPASPPAPPDTPGRRFYRVRVTDAAGVLIYDDDSVPIIGTVSGEGGGGGGGVPVDQNALAKTGDVKMKFARAADPADAGWVRCNGGTISKAGAGGSELADASTQKLYEYLWNSHSDLICPVTGGRGTTALDDFNAINKPIALPDMRGRAPFGVDKMGSAASANLIAAAYVDTPIPGPDDKRDTVGAAGGEDDIALATAQMPAHSHDATGVPAGPGGTPPAKVALKASNHGHPLRTSATSTSTNPIDGLGGVALSLDSVSTPPTNTALVPTDLFGKQLGGSGDIAITGNTGSAGGPAGAVAGVSSAHENMPPFMLIQFQIKL